MIACCKCLSLNEKCEVAEQKCGHTICWKCLESYVKDNLAPKIKCPGPNCTRYLTDGAIRKVLSDEEVERYENLMIKKLTETTKCLLAECPHIYICDNREVQFECPVCSLFNCLMCNAPHRYLSCREYKSNEGAETYCKEEIDRAKKQLKVKKRVMNREMLKELDDNDLIIYDDLLECEICCRTLARGDTVILRCSHLWCRYCLSDLINKSSNIPIICNGKNCNKPLEEREISKLVTKEELTIYIDRCNSHLKGKLGFTFQCQTPNCVYFVEYMTKPDVISCPLCKLDNCTKCYAIHSNKTCQQFKEQIKNTPYGKNLLNIEERILKKELMRCLKCHQVLEKIRGCSWIQCSNCRFEMCWALQIRRWGPKGRGDVTDGCKCRAHFWSGYCAPNCGSCMPHNA